MLSKESGAICMGLMHSTQPCQQEQHNMVVKTTSEPFVCAPRRQTGAAEHVRLGFTG